MRREQIQTGLKQRKVRVQQRLEGRMVAQWRGQPLAVEVCEQPRRSAAAAAAVANRTNGKKRSQKGGNRGWMENFHLHGGPSLEEVVAHAYGEPWEEEAE